MLNSVLNQCWD